MSCRRVLLTPRAQMRAAPRYARGEMAPSRPLMREEAMQRVIARSEPMQRQKLFAYRAAFRFVATMMRHGGRYYARAQPCARAVTRDTARSLMDTLSRHASAQRLFAFASFYAI